MRSPTFACGVAIALMSCSDKDESTTSNPCPETSVAHMNWTGEALIHDSSCGAFELRPRVIGDGSWTINFERNAEGGLVPTLTADDDSTFRGLVLEGEWSVDGEGDAVFWRQGYQSWSWSGVTEPTEPERDDDGIIIPAGDGDGRTVFDENASTSWWVGLVGKADGSSALFGLQGATKTRFFVGLDTNTIQLVWGHRGERIARDSGESLSLDPLWVGTGTDAHGLHSDYAQATAQRVEPVPLDEPPPTGWATWYQYYADVTEDDVRTNLSALVGMSDSGEPPVEVFQIDDGWQVRWGDWWAGDDFPSGMETLANDIASAGMTPGLWLAPFYMSTASETYVNHPDWWVLNEDGEPIIFTNLGTGEYVIVDVTHPDAAAWLDELIRGIVGQGYGYLKLDFLYAGAMEGIRHADVTGIEAYREGMQIIRDAAGDAWVLACGAPLLPSVGFAESFRTGSDIAFESWTEPHIDFFRWQARATAARAWTQSIWWWMDPDQLIVRDPLTSTEVSGAIASAVIASGTWMLGDDLTELEPDRLDLALDPTLTALRGQPVRPIDPLDAVSGLDPGPIVEMTQDNDTTPHLWRLEDGTTVLLNLQTDAVEVQGPGGINILSGEEQPPGVRTLPPGTGEIWR